MISICRQLLQGQDLNTICAKPPMPIGPVFLEWVKDHAEARAIYRSVRNFPCDRQLAIEVGVFPEPATVGEWEEKVRANCERGFPADWIERKYTPPDWNKVYPLLGGPPVWSTENIDAYTELLNGFTEMLEPRDFVELTDTKGAADATWEAARAAREKNSLPEHKYQERLEVFAELQRRRGAAESTAAKPATAFDHSRGLRAGFKHYQGLDIAQSRAIKRRDNALRQIARWRDGLGAKARRLSDKFIDEQALAERYGATQLIADAETDGIAGGAIQAAPPLACAGDAADAAPPMVLPDEAAEAAAALVSADKAPQNASPAPTAAAAEAAPPLPTDQPARTAPVLPSSGETAETGAPLRAWEVAVDAAPPLAPGSEATSDASPPACPGEAADAAPRGAPPDEAAEAVPPTGEGADAAPATPQGAPPDQTAEAAPPRAPADDERINWVGWLTGAERYEWIVLSKGAQKEFKQSVTSKKWLVEKLVVDRKVIRPDQVCPELARYLPVIAATVAASAEALQ
jgi:hypothetical protein